MKQHRLRLRDGRTLAAAEVGDPDGHPLFYSHGFPGSRLGAELGEQAARKHGIRLIAFDRPGWGCSDPLPGRTLSDWPRDIEQAADLLGCERFNVVGVSGGGPFALACAAALPARVGRVGLVCGLGPVVARARGDGMTWHTALGLTLAQRARWTVRPVLAIGGPLLARIFPIAIDHLARCAGPADREVIERPEIRAILEREFREAFRQGGSGAAMDGLIYGADWKIALSAIRSPVFLWHGEADRIVPVSMARWLAARIPGSRATYYKDEGHFSIVVHRLAEIFAVLAVDVA